MRSLVGESNDFVLNRWAISRARAFDLTGIERRPGKISPNDFVRSRHRGGDPARDLFHVELSGAVVIQGEDVARISANFLVVKRKSRLWVASQANFTTKIRDQPSCGPGQNTFLK